jgi:hypothetical protein
MWYPTLLEEPCPALDPTLACLGIPELATWLHITERRVRRFVAEGCSWRPLTPPVSLMRPPPSGRVHRRRPSPWPQLALRDHADLGAVSVSQSRPRWYLSGGWPAFDPADLALGWIKTHIASRLGGRVARPRLGPPRRSMLVLEIPKTPTCCAGLTLLTGLAGVLALVVTAQQEDHLAGRGVRNTEAGCPRASSVLAGRRRTWLPSPRRYARYRTRKGFARGACPALGLLVYLRIRSTYGRITTDLVDLGALISWITSI